jgi:Spy/CpxP family protein refolding chaperone
MSKIIASVIRVLAAGGLLWLSTLPESALAQSSPPGAAPPAAMPSTPPPRGSSAAPPDLLEGLTLTPEQQAQIDQIREKTKSNLAAIKHDQALSPEAADAMARGYQRLENGKILEVLTPAQQQQVRKRISDWRAATGKTQYPLRHAPVPEQTPRPQ